MSDLKKFSEMAGDKGPNKASSSEDNVDGSSNGMQTLQIGGPSEDRPRKGEMSWIPSIKKPGDIRSWNYKFRTGAGLFLSEKVYRDNAERKLAWETALLKAASEFDEMCQLIEIFSTAGYDCEALLNKIVEHYVPSLEIDRKKSAARFMAFSRGNLTLHTALKQYNLLLLECKKYDFDPGDVTVCTKLETLLKPEEMVMYNLYLNMQPAGTSIRQRAFGAVEALGKAKEDCKETETDGPFFAGGAYNKGKKLKERRSGYDPNDAHRKAKGSNFQQPSGGKTCTRCGKRCPLANGGDKTKCFAFEKKCRKCDKLGHFESMCKTKKTAAVAVEKAKEQAAEKGDSF